MVVYRVLGDLQILDRNGNPIRIKSGNHRKVLALLLMRAPDQVAADALLDAGWPPDGERSRTPARPSDLHRAIDSVRKMLTQSGGQARVQNSRDIGYTLLVPDEQLDHRLFRNLCRRAWRSDPRTTASLLSQALDLWRGPRALADFPDTFLAAAVAELSTLRRRAAIRFFETAAPLFGYGHIEQRAIEMSELFPLDTALCEWAMLACHQCGHTREVSQAYTRHVDALNEQLGDDRGAPNLRQMHELHQAIMNADAAAVARHERRLRPTRAPIPVQRAAESTAASSAAATRVVPHELRAAPPVLIGRDDEVADAAFALTRKQRHTPAVVVIKGPGGIGKTALAHFVAQRVRAHYPDGQIEVELRTAGAEVSPAGADAGITDLVTSAVDPAEVLAACLRSLGLPVPPDRSTRAKALRTALSGRQVLILLDDARHADQVRDVIPGEPGCAVIVTSNHEILLPGVPPTVIELRRLTSAQAVHLFQRLAHLPPAASPESDIAHVEQLVELCDGLPLAIDVVAALRVQERARPMREFTQRLVQAGPEAFEAGDKSLARSIRASLEHLDADAQALFFALGRVALRTIGPWTAFAVLDHAEADPYGSLSRLLASSVLVADSRGRYRMLAPTKQFAAWAARQAEPDPDVPARVYRALLTLTRAAHGALHGGDFEVAHADLPDWPLPDDLLAEARHDPLGWFRAEAANLRAAVAHCASLGLTELAWDLALSAHEFYTIDGRHDDWYETHRIALAACQAAGDRRGEALILVSLAQPALVANPRARSTAVLPALRRAVDVLRDCAEPRGLAMGLRTLGNALRRTGHVVEPRRLFLEARQHYEDSHDPLGAWQAQRLIGQVCLDQGSPDEAVAILTETLAEAQRLQSPRAIAQNRYWLGHALLLAGDPDSAQVQFDAMATPGDAVTLVRAFALHGLGEVALARQDLGPAETMLTTAIDIALIGGDAIVEGRAHLALARVRQAQGAAAGRIEELRHAARCFESAEQTFQQMTTLIELSAAYPAGSDEARAALRQAAELDRLLDLPADDRALRQRPPLHA